MTTVVPVITILIGFTGIIAYGAGESQNLTVVCSAKVVMLHMAKVEMLHFLKKGV